MKTLIIVVVFMASVITGLQTIKANIDTSVIAEDIQVAMVSK